MSRKIWIFILVGQWNKVKTNKSLNNKCEAITDLSKFLGFLCL